MAKSPGTAITKIGDYSFLIPEDANDIGALLDLGESVASFSRRAAVANHVPQKG